MSDSVEISIVVLNYNTSDLVPDALNSIVKTAGNLAIEVVVIDNASTDGGIDYLKPKFQDDPRFSFLQREKNVGFPAINVMLERARGKYILSLDPDATLHPNALQSLFSFMESNPKAGAASATFLNPDGSRQYYYRRIMTPVSYFYTTIIGRVIDKYLLGLRNWKLNRYEDLDFTTPQVVEMEQPSTPCMIWRREAVGAYLFDPDIAFYFNDVDMSRRIYDRGYKIYMLPDALITHLKSAASGRRDSAWKRRAYTRGLFLYFRKNYPAHFPWIWIWHHIDLWLRACMVLLVGREPLR